MDKLDVLTQRELDEVRCNNPECTVPHDQHEAIYLNAECHPRMGLMVGYRAATGTLVISCAECGTDVVEIQVAHAPMSRH